MSVALCRHWPRDAATGTLAPDRESLHLETIA